MAWWDSALERRSIQAGMRVRTQEGKRLGRVRFIGREVLYVRPWRFSCEGGSSRCRSRGWRG